MGFDATVADPILKDVLYSKAMQSVVTDHKNWALWAILEKRNAKLGGAWGRHFILPFKEEDTQAVGASITATETKAALAGTNLGSAPKFNGYQIDPALYYATAQVDGTYALRADGNDTGSFVDAMVASAESKFATMGKRMAMYAHGDGTANLGVIIGSPTSTTINVGRASKRRLARGMDLVGVDPATNTVRSATALGVTAIANDGTITLSASPVALGWVAGDYVAPKDDFNAVIKGLNYLNPETTPTSGQLVHGCDISLNYKLGGMRYALADYTDALDACTQAAMDMGAEGNFPTTAIANPITWQSIASLLPNQTVYKTALGEGNIGFDTIKIRTPDGVFELLSDPAAKTTTVRLLDTKHVFFMYAGPALIHDLTAGTGAAMVRKGTGDTWITQLRAMVQLGCDLPNSLGVITGFPQA
jgi:hypothetical protein